MNWTLLQILHCTADENPGSWPKRLPTVISAYRIFGSKFRCLRYVISLLTSCHAKFWHLYYVKWNIWHWVKIRRKNNSVAIATSHSALSIIDMNIANCNFWHKVAWSARPITSHNATWGSQPISVQQVRSAGSPRRPHGCSSHFTRLVAVVGCRRVIWASVWYRHWRDGPWNRKASRRNGTSIVRASFECIYHEELGQVCKRV